MAKGRGHSVFADLLGGRSFPQGRLPRPPCEDRRRVQPSGQKCLPAEGEHSREHHGRIPAVEGNLPADGGRILRDSLDFDLAFVHVLQGGVLHPLLQRSGRFPISTMINVAETDISSDTDTRLITFAHNRVFGSAFTPTGCMAESCAPGLVDGTLELIPLWHSRTRSPWMTGMGNFDRIGVQY